MAPVLQFQFVAKDITHYKLFNFIPKHFYHFSTFTCRKTLNSAFTRKINLNRSFSARQWGPLLCHCLVRFMLAFLDYKKDTSTHFTQRDISSSTLPLTSFSSFCCACATSAFLPAGPYRSPRKTSKLVTETGETVIKYHAPFSSSQCKYSKKVCWKRDFNKLLMNISLKIFSLVS